MFPITITLSGTAAYVHFDPRSCRKILAEEPFLEVILGTLLRELGYGFNYFYICDLQHCLPYQHYLTGRPGLGSVEFLMHDLPAYRSIQMMSFDFRGAETETSCY